MKSLPHIEVILPIYNEVRNIQHLVRGLDEVSAQLARQASISYLFVDDGSHDGSRELLYRLFQQRKDIRVVELIHNFGHPAALTCGLDYFEGDIAVFMDADLQDAPSVLVDMFSKWKAGAKTVVAERGIREEKFRCAFKAFYFLLHKTASRLPPINFGTHCMLDKSVVERIRHLKEKDRYFPGLVSYASGEITPIRIDRSKRYHGNSRVGMFGLLHLAITAFVSFSSTPVRVVAILGLLSSTGALLAALTIVSIKVFTDKAIPGWASILTATFLASGVQLLCLGIIGEYIARIYDEVKGRPLYLIDKVRDRKFAKHPAEEVA